MDAHNSHAPEPQLADCMQAIARAGLSSGRSGNASVRTVTGMRITPSGVVPDALREEMMVEMTLDGELPLAVPTPSSEWRMHAGIYRARPDAMAIVHCHSRYATALACGGHAIPAFHYMVAAAGGDSIRCAPYAIFGSAALADHALEALAGRRACLLANHGQIALGPSLQAALALAAEVEELAAQYWATLAIGGPRLLDSGAMGDVLQKFGSYGQQPATPGAPQD